jgi:hypothetical protein
VAVGRVVSCACVGCQRFSPLALESFSNFEIDLNLQIKEQRIRPDGVDESQLKFLKEIWHMSKFRTDAPHF